MFDKNYNTLYPQIIMSEISNAVHDRRKALGWTQDELARRSGVHVNTVINVEAGERDTSMLTLGALSKALGCTVVDLLQPVAKPRRRKTA